MLNVCQRILGDFHAAQDASQATFMVLARKAGMLDRSTPLGGWLYKVAYHLALRSRAVNARQRVGEREAANELDAPSTDATTPDLDRRGLHQVIHEELAGLPEKYRAPLTLCYLDGRSHAEAAREIGLPRRVDGQAGRRGLELPPRACSTAGWCSDGVAPEGRPTVARGDRREPLESPIA